MTRALLLLHRMRNRMQRKRRRIGHACKSGSMLHMRSIGVSSSQSRLRLSPGAGSRPDRRSGWQWVANLDKVAYARVWERFFFAHFRQESVVYVGGDGRGMNAMNAPFIQLVCAPRSLVEPLNS